MRTTTCILKFIILLIITSFLASVAENSSTEMPVLIQDNFGGDAESVGMEVQTNTVMQNE